MIKKDWLNPQLMDLKVEKTKEPSTLDFPDYWACKGCGKQYISISKPEYACKRCGSTEGYTFTIGNGSAVTLPDFSGAPTVS